MIFLLVSYASSESWAVFVLGENHFRKCFFGNAGVWLVWKIEFSGNWFPLTQKKRLWLRKWISVPIFTSNEFRRERERESESARGRQRPSRRLHTSKLQSAPFASTSAVDRDPRLRTCLRTDRDQRGALRSHALALSLSLSLSLSLWNSFEVKIGTEIHFRSQSLFFLGQRKSISGPIKHPHF